jgi:hypothetical protein
MTFLAAESFGLLLVLFFCCSCSLFAADTLFLLLENGRAASVRGLWVVRGCGVSAAVPFLFGFETYRAATSGYRPLTNRRRPCDIALYSSQLTQKSDREGERHGESARGGEAGSHPPMRHLAQHQHHST